jgi:hypothetical protein
MTTKSSKNWEWFKYLSNNRPISKKHLSNLRKQFDKYGNITEISPGVVNSNGFIIEGQHRRILCEEFDMPFFYNEIDADKEITAAINASRRPWSAWNYIEFYAAYKPEYELLRRFMVNNDITYPIANALLFTNLNRKYISDQALKDGTLEVKYFLPDAQKHADMVSEISEKMGSKMSERYVRGLVRCFYSDNFDYKRFMKKLDIVMGIKPDLPSPRVTALADVMRNIETIYNFRAQEGSYVMLFR